MDPTRLERSLGDPAKIVIRQQRERLLGRILEFARLTIDDVVNDPRAKVEVRRWYRVADECAWETLRGALEARVALTWWVRANR